jgi:hypothetical protein
VTLHHVDTLGKSKNKIGLLKRDQAQTVLVAGAEERAKIFDGVRAKSKKQK